MNGLLKKVLVFTAIALVLLAAGAWLILASPMMADMRGNLAASFLSKKIGQDIEFRDGVQVSVGQMVTVSAEGVTLPNAEAPDAAPIYVERLSFQTPARGLISGQIDLQDIQVDGARIVLAVDQTGQTSLPAFGKAPDKAADKAPSSAPQDGPNAALAFLTGREIRLSNSQVIYQDARNGLDLDLLLTSLEVSRENASAPVSLSGNGSLNGETMTLSGTFPLAEPFKAEMKFSQVTALIEGAPAEDGYDAGLTANLSLQIAQLGQLLDMLKLQKSVDGTGQVTARFQSGGGKARIDDLNVQVDLDGGQSVSVTGDVGELGNPADVSLDTRIRLYPEDKEPAPTQVRRDLKLIAVDMTLSAQPNGIPQRGMVIKTNGFVLDTSGEGPPPFAVSKISRTPDGLLRLGAVVLRIGPPEAHFLVLEGSVDDALRLDGITANASLDLPAASLLAPEVFQDSDVLGKVTGGFLATGNATELAISQVKAASSGTDLWHLDVTGSVQNALKFAGIDLKVSADVPSAADFLTALELDPIETGPVSLSADLNSEGTEWRAEASVSVAESELAIKAELDAEVSQPMVRGQVESDLIRIEHLRDIVNAAVELAKLDDRAPQPKTDETESASASDTDTPDEAEPGPIRDMTLQPLGRAILLSGMDLAVAIDMRKIEGPKGTTSLTSDLELKDRKARFGPAKFEYGGGHFEVSGSMDLDAQPEILNLSGSTGGWDLGEILHELRFKKGASGTLYASFDVAGHTASVGDFLRGMDGNATVSMKNGSIDTQLLDLAGLGVIPWLFTKEPGKTAPLVCLQAPIHVSNGQITTRQTVVETHQVQLVVYGSLDVVKQTLDVNGQPRRIGKPLSRSPWPFTISGALSDPKVKVKDGPKRLRRKDGASTMPDRRKLCVPDILQLK